jgi:hypothetical protein
MNINRNAQINATTDGLRYSVCRLLSLFVSLNLACSKRVWPPQSHYKSLFCSLLEDQIKSPVILMEGSLLLFTTDSPPCVANGKTGPVTRAVVPSLNPSKCVCLEGLVGTGGMIVKSREREGSNTNSRRC